MYISNLIKVNIAILLIVVGLVIAAETFHAISGSQLTTGRVTNIELRRTGSDGSMTYIPTILFLDNRGIEHRVATIYSTYNFKLGKELEIYYDPKDLSHVRLSKLYSLWGVPLIFVSLGVVLLVPTRKVKGMEAIYGS
ncbi:MAG: DUF3592 domain-containing protein [Cocleimonas sp.]